MSVTQTTIGGAVVFAVLQFSMWAILPTPMPISVHSLTIDSQSDVVALDRTIPDFGHPAVTLIWTATVEDANGDSIIRCEGSGVRGFLPGRKIIRFTLPSWTGRDGCTLSSLKPGLYRLRASWRGGEVSTGVISDPFIVEEKQ